MRPTTVSADQRWCTPHVGLIQEDALWRRPSSTSRTLSRHESWRRWQNCLPSMPRHATKHGPCRASCATRETGSLVLDEIRAQIEAASTTALPSSPLGKACSYTLRLWDQLTHFVHYPVLELSNNLAENSMRPIHRSPQLDAHGTPEGRTTRGRHPLRGRILPPTQHPRPRVSRRCSARHRQHIHSETSRTHTQRLANKQP
jgi:hypothetical protein